MTKKGSIFGGDIDPGGWEQSSNKMVNQYHEPEAHKWSLVSSEFFLIRIKIGFVSQICLISGIFVDWARDP